ncbi:MAG: dipeptidase PepE [Candidatus Azobacteroides sp.]|nr:dipeptidase PepE [Candidatus Azobacteroides sp.]
MRLLLLSNSTNAGEEYLAWAKEPIKDFLGNRPSSILFIPYAAVRFDYEAYETKVNAVFSEMGYTVQSIHRTPNPIQAVEKAEAIVVGGGNTWRLLQMMRKQCLFPSIKSKVASGTPYIGWSAGSNVACPSIKTTNDMPVVDPRGFNALNLVPFQINPHFLDVHPEGFGGETREDRILEFIELNPQTCVLGLREGCLLKREGDALKLIGSKTMRLFRNGWITREVSPGEDLSFLLKNAP